MPKKYLTIISAKIFFLVFCCVVLLTSKAFAINLEVQYPAIGGQVITATTKLPDFVKYLFNAGVFLGFLSVFISLAIAGVMYLLSSVNIEMRASAKDRVSGAISGLLILALVYLIVVTINPQLSILNINSLPPTSPSPVETKSPGVYFYNNPGCTPDDVQPNATSVSDLGALKNRIHSVGIVNDATTGYISILYDNTNFFGKCKYINPSITCDTPVDPFAASASIYVYDYNPNGDGVYFYRKSYFDDTGGYFKVNNSQISGIYAEELKNLKFLNVPYGEQDCTKYNTNGECTTRTPPSLEGENISSVEIKGDYLVLFVYAGHTDDPNGPWTSCQEFPTIDDVNKLGPQQIKWQNIRNSNGGTIPNAIAIIPIKR